MSTAATSISSDHATADEVAEAAARLTPQNYLRLYRAARICLAGSTYTDAEDLVTEAVATPFMAALGQGGRRWPRAIDFMAFLIMTIRGLASDSRRRPERKLTVSQYEQAPDGQERDRFAARSCPTAHSPEDLALDDQDHQDMLAVLAAVQEYFSEDPQVQWVMKGIEGDLPPAEVQQLSGMSVTHYESARRRFRRGVEKLLKRRST